MALERSWFVLKCLEGDTLAFYINFINTRNDVLGSNKIIGLKFWVGQHPNETACRDTVLIKFANPVKCNKPCGQIFNERIVIFSFMNSSVDEKTRIFLMHGRFVINGPYLQDILLSKNEVLEHEQHVLKHAALTREVGHVAAKVLLREEEKLMIIMKEHKAVSAAVLELKNERKIYEAQAAFEISIGNRVANGKRGLDTAADPCYPVYRKSSEYAPGLGLFAARDFKAQEVVARMENAIPLRKSQEKDLYKKFGIRHDSVVSMGQYNNSVWDMNVSKRNKVGPSVDLEPLWYCMNHRRDVNANVRLLFETINGVRYPVWKTKKAVKANIELSYDYGLVPDSFKE